MKQYDKDNWYDRNGVERPSEDRHLTEEELEKAFRKQREETVHGNWTQSGNYITCNNCTLKHSSPIPVDYLLQGTDEKGLPILTKIQLN